jgi:hypothetical protein
MPKSTNPDDPRGLIAEAYKIEGIDEAQCRSIFLDWSLDTKISDPVATASRLARDFGRIYPVHPMTGILRAASEPPQTGRRGGRQGRRAS